MSAHPLKLRDRPYFKHIRPGQLITLLFPFLLLVDWGALRTIPRYNGLLAREAAFAFAILLVLAIYFLESVFSPQKDSQRRQGAQPQPDRLPDLFRPERRSQIAYRTELAVTGAFYGLALLSAASLLWTPFLYQSLHHTGLWIIYLATFILFRQALTIRRRLVVATAVVGLVAGSIAVLGIIEYYSSSFAPPSLSFAHRSVLAEILITAMPIYIMIFLCSRRQCFIWASYIVAVASFLAVLETGQRAPALGMLCSLILIAAFLFLKKARPINNRRILILVATLVALLIFQLVPSPLNRPQQEIASRLVETVQVEPNTQARLLFWGVALEMFKAHPLIGVGPGAYEPLYANYRARFVKNPENEWLSHLQEEALVERTHNEYLQLLAEMGAPGLVLFLLLCCGILYSGWLTFKSSNNVCVLGAIAGMVAFLISAGASSFGFRWIAGGVMFFFIASIATAPCLTRDRGQIRRRGDAFADAGTETSYVGTSECPTSSIRSTFYVLRSRLKMERRTDVFTLAFCLLLFAFFSWSSVRVMLGQLHEQRGNGVQFFSSDATKAIDEYNETLRFNPYNFGAKFNLGMALYHSGKAAESIPHLEYALRNGINVSVAYAYLAIACERAGEIEKAEQVLLESIAVYPKSVFLRSLYAEMLRRQGRTAEAGKYFASASQIDARQARGWYNLLVMGRAAAIAAVANGDLPPGQLKPENAIFLIMDREQQAMTARIQ